MIKIVLAVIFYLAVIPKNAYGYLDPGTGSYAIQIIIGFLLGGLYVGRKAIGQAMSYFTKMFSRHNDDDEKQS